MAHLKGELTGDMEETVVLLLLEPTDFAVEGMHRAMDGVGTDERLLMYSTLVHSAKPQVNSALLAIVTIVHSLKPKVNSAIPPTLTLIKLAKPQVHTQWSILY